ncbi:hypothetical protein CEN49_20140 [Fischerella thermalis CCMEE 5273]|nr:hypothetical protein CEN49_20140 [Fischerella thermalis CCMEE 5273]PMB49127.1 hypothetical protein CEN40_05715 [Fischerella thermalis CCMEE 5205]
MVDRNTEQYVVVKGAVPRYLKLQFKVLCIQRKLQMSSVLEDLIGKWIQAGGPFPEYLVNWSSSNQDNENVKGYIPESLKLQFKALCAQKRVTMCSVLYHLIDEWVRTGGSTSESP